jgi:pilus assembly protein Flp/PilA
MEFPMWSTIVRMAQDESGATSIEYAVIAGLISVFCLTVPTIIGTKLNVKFAAVSNGLN